MKSSPQGEIAAYLDSLTPAARNDLVELDRLIVSWQPQLERRLWQSMGRSIIGSGQVELPLRQWPTGPVVCRWSNCPPDRLQPLSLGVY